MSTLALGIWQVNRRKWKTNLIETLKSRTQAEPISLLEKFVFFLKVRCCLFDIIGEIFSLDRLPELEYYPVRVRGKFDHSREILIEPRSRLDTQAHENRTGARQAPPSQSFGAHVITPFRVANRKSVINL